MCSAEVALAWFVCLTNAVNDRTHASLGFVALCAQGRTRACIVEVSPGVHRLATPDEQTDEFDRVMAARAYFLDSAGLPSSTCLSAEQCGVVMRTLRRLYSLEVAVNSVYQKEVREVGRDMASRRLRSRFRTAMRLRFGHGVVVNALVTLGWWSPHYAEELDRERQRRAAECLAAERLAAERLEVAGCPRGNRTTGMRRKGSKAQKAHKRDLYNQNVVSRCQADPACEAWCGC